jgi:hypothetical protein
MAALLVAPIVFASIVIRKRRARVKLMISLSPIMLVATIGLLACVNRVAGADAASFGESRRPQVHFTPEKNWLNDSNGLVFFQGDWHLFYPIQPRRIVMTVNTFPPADAGRFAIRAGKGDAIKTLEIFRLNSIWNRKG